MKIFSFDYNGILQDVLPKLDITDDIRNADSYLLWQDVRGACKTLCELNKDYFGRPVTVVQHGRGATRDYLPPNSFPMFADKICVWGKAEKDRLERIGLGDRAVITGSPLKPRLIERKPKEMREGNNIVYVPVIADREQPENVEWYYELKKIEIEKCQEKLRTARAILKEQWHAWHVKPDCVTDGQIPYDVLSSDFRVIAKLTGIHDKRLYMGSVNQSLQQNKTHIDDCIKLLSYADVVVAVEEGTFPLLAMAMDIPVVMIEGFKYGSYAGVAYDSVETIKTDGAHWTDAAHLREAVEHALAHPEDRKEARKAVVENEFCPSDIDDPIKKIVEVVLRETEALV